MSCPECHVDCSTGRPAFRRSRAMQRPVDAALRIAVRRRPAPLRPSSPLYPGSGKSHYRSGLRPGMQRHLPARAAASPSLPRQRCLHQRVPLDSRSNGYARRHNRHLRPGLHPLVPALLVFQRDRRQAFSPTSS
jgi:hypothetical protein